MSMNLTSLKCLVMLEYCFVHPCSTCNVNPVTITSLRFFQNFLLVSELLFLFLCIDLEPPPCSDGDVRLQSNYTNSLRYDDSFVMQISGNLEICYNGIFRGLCASGDYNFQQTAELACLSFGYTSE